MWANLESKALKAQVAIDMLQAIMPEEHHIALLELDRTIHHQLDNMIKVSIEMKEGIRRSRVWCSLFADWKMARIDVYLLEVGMPKLNRGTCVGVRS